MSSPLLKKVSLEDKYIQEEGPIFLNGIQALVRLPLIQKRLDLSQGLNTAGFISGYRGSPLGGFDQGLWKAQKHLDAHDIKFQPGLNEDLAATSVWGTQQVNLFEGATVDGVFGMWYGKGPGVDRSGDVLKHANAAGTSKHGGVLALAGDDHACKSSSLPHQSEYGFIDASLPILHPANIQDILDMGVLGFALSRYSGCWVGFKTLADTIDTSASVHVDLQTYTPVIPEDFQLPAGGLNIRWPDTPLAQEDRLLRYKLQAAQAFVRANKMDKCLFGGYKSRIGIVATGKGYLDTRQALDDLGLTPDLLKELGISLYKVAMTWPLEPTGIQEFSKGLDQLIVVEEKRPILENQIKEILYSLPSDQRPQVYGKHAPNGEDFFPLPFELNPPLIALKLGSLLRRLLTLPDHVLKHHDFIHTLLHSDGLEQSPVQRLPFYCSGCPHNTSTRVLPGSRAVAGIGCHYMANWIFPGTATFTQMGGEGVPWIGQAPFTTTPHIFANLGDGTYYHSGILAIRASVASGVNVTYKLLYNDAVAMTGGQPVDGPLDVPTITRQLSAEGVQKIVIVTDEPEKYPKGADFAKDVKIYHRHKMQEVEKELTQWPGVSVLIYDQTCAAEKRRRRKRGLMIDPPKRAFINKDVCEGCGDCSKKSNCLSVNPLETHLGRKRTIDQSSCNKDFSCIDGFCPSFVTIHGGKPKKHLPPALNTDDLFKVLPNPIKKVTLDKPFNIYMAGVGGTGVITVGALLGMAAHLEGKGCSIIDMAGLAQKGGAVTSHIRLGQKPEDLHGGKISVGGTDLLLGCDLVTASVRETLITTTQNHTYGVINDYQSITGHFMNDPSYAFHHEDLKKRISDALGEDRTHFINATQIAHYLLGDTLMSNLFILGYTYQLGLLPLSQESLFEAITLNEVQVDINKTAFLWGRLAAFDPEKVKDLAPVKNTVEVPEESLEDKLNRRSRYLREYQNESLSNRYRALMDRAKTFDEANGTQLLEDIHNIYFRLLSYKDEYEVARLYTNGDFMRAVKDQFEGNLKLSFHLAPPLISRRNSTTGELQKREFGPWILQAFKLLAPLKILRGTPFDLFGYTAERKMERKMIVLFETFIEGVMSSNTVTPKDKEILEAFRCIKGFGHVKEKPMHHVLDILEKGPRHELSTTPKT